MDDLYNASSVKGNSYASASAALRRRLAEELPADQIRRLHGRRPVLHFLIVGWQFFLIGGAGFGLWHLTNPVWVALLALVMGFTLFNFTVLLHEVVHDAVLRKRNTRLNRVLGPRGLLALERLMGMLLVTVAIDMLIDGIKQTFFAG